MAITRAQQAKQLLKEGGRTGFFLGGSDYTSPSKSESRSRTDRAQAAAAAENRESRRGTIGSYTSTPQTYDSPPQQFVASDDDKRTNIITGGGARFDDDTPVVPKDDDGPIKFV